MLRAALRILLNVVTWLAGAVGFLLAFGVLFSLIRFGAIVWYQILITAVALSLWGAARAAQKKLAAW